MGLLMLMHHKWVYWCWCIVIIRYQNCSCLSVHQQCFWNCIACCCQYFVCTAMRMLKMLHETMLFTLGQCIVMGNALNSWLLSIYGDTCLMVDWEHSSQQTIDNVNVESLVVCFSLRFQLLGLMCLSLFILLWNARDEQVTDQPANRIKQQQGTNEPSWNPCQFSNGQSSTTNVTLANRMDNKQLVDKTSERFLEQCSNQKWWNRHMLGRITIWMVVTRARNATFM